MRRYYIYIFITVVTTYHILDSVKHPFPHPLRMINQCYKKLRSSPKKQSYRRSRGLTSQKVGTIASRNFWRPGEILYDVGQRSWFERVSFCSPIWLWYSNSVSFRIFGTIRCCYSCCYHWSRNCHLARGSPALPVSWKQSPSSSTLPCSLASMLKVTTSRLKKSGVKSAFCWHAPGVNGLWKDS